MHLLPVDLHLLLLPDLHTLLLPDLPPTLPPSLLDRLLFTLDGMFLASLGVSRVVGNLKKKCVKRKEQQRICQMARKKKM